jgi:hypothetical protein
MINWEFTVTQQMHSSRYGVLNGEYYKQVIVGGKPMSRIHPPKKVHEIVYDMARKRAGVDG